jgi:hypothetical protein
MNIIICGGRWVTDRETVDKYLDYLVDRYGDELVIFQGGAPGADTLAKEYCERNGVRCETFEAEWDECGPDCPPAHMKQNSRGDLYCKSAGHRRNTKMLQAGAKAVTAFVDRPLHKSSGTQNMVEQAKAADVWTRIIKVKLDPSEFIDQSDAVAPEHEGEWLVRVTLDFVCFGLVLKQDRVVRAAPIAKYTTEDGGWTLERIRSYFEGKRKGKVELVGDVVAA